MSDSQLFSNVLDAKTSISIINRFREKYHNGKPEQVIPQSLHPSLYQKYKDVPVNSNIPKDIELFRLAYLNALTYKLPLRWGFSILTWTVLPHHTVEVELDIFDKPDFLSLPSVFVAIWSTGEEIYSVDVVKIRDFFFETTQRNKDFYLFTDEMQWCISINHDDKIFLSQAK